MFTRISEIKSGTNVKVAGFIEKIRDQKSIQFIILRDFSGIVQIVVDKETQQDLLPITEKLSINSFINVKGKVVENPAVKLGGKEIIPDEIKIDSIAETLPIDQTSSIDQRLDFRWLDLRQPKNFLMMKVQTFFTKLMRDFFCKNNFVEIHSPKIISQPSESGSDLFTLEYFGEKAYLTQSPQFYKQMAISSGFEKVFEIGPVFRAEKSFTSRHATEFTGIDIEMANIYETEEIMEFEEQMIFETISAIKEKFGEEIKKLFGVEIQVPKLPFPRIKMNEAIEILQDLDFDIEFGEDFSTESERALSEYLIKKNGHEFFFITGYPAEIRAFYHMHCEKDPMIVKGYDLYWKGVEITTGAIREHRYEKLLEQALERGNSQEKLNFYLDFFKYGCPAHGGFGIGLDRMTMLLLGIPSIKESMFIFRGPTRIKP
ncbi:MAG: aspartate--tRNA(Asn) ligase [Clostridia bacterium]|jgi:aspartyl-tRNA synthetase|nr:aspartate--tRNA(Asn) ligase [Clostridia bacterium]MDD4408791.1 aspartate--tRNA(Asn) ligase [Clostridia bacterium]